MKPWVSRGLIAVVCVVVLAGCSTGDSERAEEDATREADDATNVVGNVEATQVAREFFGPTEEPTPYPTKIPSLANLRLTTSLGDQDQPTETIYVYRSGSGPLFADAQIATLFPGQTVVALWIRNGDVVGSSEVNIENERELVWIALRWDGASSAQSGTYTVVIQVRGPGTNDEGTPAETTTDIGSLVFRIE